MKLKRPILLAFLFIVCGGIYAQDNIVNLTCKGIVTQTTDGRLEGSKQELLNVVVNPKNALLQIDGNWGCTLHLAKSEQVVEDKCGGILPIRVSNDEFSYSSSLENTSYDAQSMFKLNRHSGSFSGSGIVRAKPGSKAHWGLIDLTAKMQCEKADQKF